MQFAVILVALCAGAVPRDWAQSSARPSPIEVVAPKPPTPVTIEEKQALIYELHITNFGPSSLKLTEIQVYGSGDTKSTDRKTGTEVGDYTGESLSALLRPVLDPPQTDGDPAQLDVGRRVIAFMFVTLPPGLRVSALRHRFLFDVADSSRSRGTANDETALDDVIVPVIEKAPLVLAPPFKDGIWLAGNGPSNVSVHRRSVIAINGRAYLSQRFAIDWVMVGDNGNSFHDNRDRNENFWAFGQPVLAVADAEVAEVVDGIPDNVPGKLPVITVQNIAGNHVILRIAPHVHVMFGHLRQGSIRVRLHQKVQRGFQIGEVGNSGSTTGAHLHLQVTDGNSALASEGLPFIFERFRFLGFGKDFELDRHPDLPRSRALPADDSVVSFR